ncbi:MAG: radical SAM protein [Candidatus Hydrogenedentes bacterium]|nr:radical SAM protein [Candidatus Hydrogenedentota bacterium]
MKPIYLCVSEDQLEGTVEWARNALLECSACPRNCKVNRYNGEIGFCKVGRYPRISSAFPHFGEEPCLTGWKGSGTIFFSGCNLNCVFCQNYEISQYPIGSECTPAELAEMMIQLQSIGCHNINLVSPSHVVPQIIESLFIARKKGLGLPIVYNTNAYDSVDTLSKLRLWIDIYMPDMKYWMEESSTKYSNAKSYPSIAKLAIKEMHNQVGDLILDPHGIAQRGLLVRHLVMPNMVEESKEIVKWLASEISKNTYINIMDQYRPAYKVPNNPKYTEIARRTTRAEIDEVFDFAKSVGLWRFAE